MDKTIVGQPFGSWMSYKADGIFKTKQEVYEYLSKYDVQIGAPGVGRIRYKDLFQGWTGNHSTRLIDAMNAWNVYEQTGVYNCNIPALTVVDNNVETRSSTFFIEDGSYVKLKTLTLGYTFPDKWIKKARLSNLRVYLQAQNVFTLTNYTGADPEGLGYPYPQPRTYTFGLSLGF